MDLGHQGPCSDCGGRGIWFVLGYGVVGVLLLHCVRSKVDDINFYDEHDKRAREGR